MADRRQDLPVARSAGLTTQELDNEILIYDHETDVAHCLQGDAAATWRRCDGKTTPEALASPDLDVDAVIAILSELDELDLLVRADESPVPAGGISRRAMVSRLAVSAASAPLILSVVAPTAQAASSCVPTGGACNVAGAVCCSPNICCGNNSHGNKDKCVPSASC